MRLFWSSRSPFVRKVMIVAHETGYADKLELLPITVSPRAPNAELMHHNPLSQLPTLLLEGDEALYGSAAICDYLDGCGGATRLFPASGAERRAALRRQALGDGLMEIALQLRLELARPPEHRNSALLAAFEAKLEAGLDSLEREAAALAQSAFDIGGVTLGCFLSYLDFRLAERPWRVGRPRLTAWHDSFRRRPSVQATEFEDPR